MVGQNIGKYRVLDRIGRGGMGTVYRAIDETLHREVAIKVLNAELNDPEVAKRFRAEAITVARLSHPGIATIYELFQHDGQWLMVMEFVRGETLEHMVERMGAVSPQRTAELCMQTLAALAHAHSMGVVHRDLKPANIMITETGAIKVMDFGIARVAGTEHLTNIGFMMGTPAYMAPEQVMGKEIDARADLYSMGVVFYRLTTGKLPFKGETPFAMAQSQVHDPPTPLGVFRSDLPPWVEQVVVRALAKSPAERFQSAVEFHEGFARCLAGLPMTPLYNPSAPTEMLMTPSQRMAQPPVAQSTSPQTASGFEPTVLSPTPMALRAPTGQASTVAPDAPPAAPSAAIPIAAQVAAPASVPNAEAQVDNSGKSGRRKTSVGLIAAAAALVVVAGGAAIWFNFRRAPATPQATDAAAGPAPEALAPVAPAPPVAVATPPARSAAVPPRSDAAPVTTVPPTAAAAGRGTPSVAETALTYPDVKLLIVNGRKTDDEDVTLSFADGQVSLIGKKSGNVLAAMPYRSALRATYARARDPKWDATIFGPPQNLDVGGVLRTSKHWLVLQSQDAYVILRLDDSHWRQVLDTVASRTNLTIERPASNDKT